MVKPREGFLNEETWYTCKELSWSQPSCGNGVFWASGG